MENCCPQKVAVVKGVGVKRQRRTQQVPENGGENVKQQ